MGYGPITGLFLQDTGLSYYNRCLICLSEYIMPISKEYIQKDSLFDEMTLRFSPLADSTHVVSFGLPAGKTLC
jgi:hypothetical protein